MFRHRSLPAEPNQRAVALVGFGDKVFPTADLRIGAAHRHVRPDAIAGRAVASREHVRNHRRCRRFAVSSGHRDVVGVIHQGAQQQPAPHPRNLQFGRRLKFHVLTANGRRVDHQLCPFADILARMAGMDSSPQFLQLLHAAIGRHVRPGDAVPLLQ